MVLRSLLVLKVYTYTFEKRCICAKKKKNYLFEEGLDMIQKTQATLINKDVSPR